MERMKKKMSSTCSTKKSSELCPECKEINNTEVYLKEITITNSQTITFTSTDSQGGSSSQSQTVKMETKILQCPCCKTIYDEKVHTLTSPSGWRAQYDALMAEYELGGELPDYDGTSVQSE